MGNSPILSGWCSPASGHVGGLGGGVDDHAYGGCLPGTLGGQQDFISLRDWRTPGTDLYPERKCFIQISAQLYQRIACPPPPTFSAFSLLFFLIAPHSSVQYSVWGVYLSSQCLLLACELQEGRNCVLFTAVAPALRVFIE